MFNVSPGETVVDQFAVFEDDGITKHVGLTQDDFTVRVWKSGVVETLSVTIAEIASSGEYAMTYTPPDPGFWKIEAFSSYSGEYYQSLAEVGISSSLDDLKDDMELALALLQLNAMVDKQVYNAAGDMTGARVRAFNAPSNVPSVPGGTETVGKKFEFEIETTYMSPGLANKFTLKRIP